MVTQQEQSIQVSTPILWDRVSPKVNIGDRICIPFTPIMQVIDKDVYPSGKTWLLVKPNSGSYTEEWVLEAEEDIQQPAEPQPLFEEEAEFKQGFQHSQLDVTSAKPPAWSVQYDGEYWYKVWVDRVLVGKATTSEKAERLAQKHIAGKKFWQEHRERVLAAYAH